jgi:hypothetical protein
MMRFASKNFLAVILGTLLVSVSAGGCSDDEKTEEKPVEAAAVDGGNAAQPADPAAAVAADAAKDLTGDNVAAEIDKLAAEIESDNDADEGDPE